MQRKMFNVSGQVQGVGFRPFVFRLAARFSLSGTVKNGPEGVSIEVQGTPEDLAGFAAALVAELPPLARISALHERDLPVLAGESSFSIVASTPGLAHEVLISPDVATCADCLADMCEQSGRRYRYPFTNCTNCGPRYSITRSMPYDRINTSMSCFALCPECRTEYENPLDRRFHAQPNACPVCGPQIWLAGGDFKGDAAIAELVRRLKEGAIAAVKGLGGFHLVCDAGNELAVQRLRKVKQRPHKPLAVMVADLDMARRLARIGPDEERLLTSLECPIVLCPLREGTALAPSISPDTSYVGLMLPYTPLHHLILGDSGLPLVMTSGNRGGEPIALGNREALSRLAELAEVFLLHNRDILIRNDDSVVRPVPGPISVAMSGPMLEGIPVQMPGSSLEDSDASVMYLRRARGFVPRPLALPKGTHKAGTVLALGAELKNTICLSRGEDAFVSQHIGDLQNLETSFFQQEIASHLASALQVNPAAVVQDAHPDFTNQSSGLYSELPHKSLQHHFAHTEAVLAENSETGPALVLALDGTGYAPPALNPEGSIWGGELIFAHPAQNILERLGGLSLVPLPGGEAAILQPWRIAHGLLCQLGLLDSSLRLPWLEPEMESNLRVAKMIPHMLERGLNSPASSSAGRLFDAVSALLGLCIETTYEGQAAIRLEEAQFAGSAPEDWQALYAGVKLLPCPLKKQPRAGLVLELDTLELFSAIYEARLSGADSASLARSFHWSLGEGLADLALAGSKLRGTKLVGLSGGVMQNMSLVLLLKDKLRARGLLPLTHHRLPANDGCISYGQLVWGLRNFVFA